MTSENQQDQQQQRRQPLQEPDPAQAESPHAVAAREAGLGTWDREVDHADRTPEYSDPSTTAGQPDPEDQQVEGKPGDGPEPDDR